MVVRNLVCHREPVYAVGHGPPIADRLVISHRTVENHVQSTLRKLQLHNRVELARYAIEHGLDVEPD